MEAYVITGFDWLYLIFLANLLVFRFTSN